MLLVVTLSFVKLLWPLLRFSSCTHDQDKRTPTNKLLTLTLRVTLKHAFFIYQIITPFIYHVSLSQKFHVPKRIVWAMLKKGKKRKRKKISMPKGMREKGVQRCPPKKREKKHSPPSPYFLEKNEIHDKGVQKENRIRKYSTHLHILIKVYALHLLGSGF